MPKNIEEPEKVEKVQEFLQYRYVCEGCTNNVLSTVNQMVGVKVTCPICSKEQITKEENFIEL